MDEKNIRAVLASPLSFDGIRIDDATKKASVNDVIQRIVGCDADICRKYFIRLPDHLKERCEKMQINGKGQVMCV